MIYIVTFSSMQKHLHETTLTDLGGAVIIVHVRLLRLSQPLGRLKPFNV